MMKVIVRKQVQSRAAPMLQSVAISSLLVIISLIHRPAAVGAFRVSFSNRLYKSMQQHSNPQLNPPETLIRPIECRNANNHTEVGICMFSIDCMQNKGVPLSICKHNYFVGTCCKLPDYNNFVGIVYDLRETETAALLQGRRGGISINNNNNSNRDGAASGPKTTEQKLSSPSPQQQHQNSSANNSANLSASSETPAPSGSESSSPVGQQASSEQPLGASVLEKRSTVAAANSYDNYELVGSSLPTAAVSANLVLSKLHQLDEKYVISSTKLFQAASSATTTSLSPIETQPQTVRFPSETAASSGHQSGTNTSSGSETARNADGSSQQQQVGAASLGASNMVQHPGGHETHTTTTPLISFASSASNEEQASAAAGGNGKLAGATLSGGPYELVANKSSGDDLSPASPGQTGLDIIQGTLVSSAHSAPSMSRLSIQQQQQHQNSVYLLGDDSDPVSTQRLSAPPAVAPSSSASIVLSSNHQPNESKKQQHQASPASDQEFTISTTSQDSSSPVSSLIISSAPFSLAPNPSLSTSSWSSTPSSQSLAPIAEEFLTSSAIPANSSQSSESANMSAGLPASASASLSSVTLPPPPPAASIKQEANISSSSNNNNDNAPLSVTSSPYVDLVSSHSTQRQTTTPFTSSLSTAILPNISSHPYAPTTLAPAISSSQAYVSVPSSSHSSSSSLSSSSSAATSTAAVTSQQQVSTTSSGLPLGASQQQEPQQASASSASSVSPLFYSTSHSQQATASPTGPGSTSTTLGSHGALGLIHLGPRPGGGAGGLGGLHVASKIVTGSSTTNNLIPGLSGLQSAILSHIPFKLASGLSSGLSSYLQAAMKPNGANRPLISSNTATALQYQQHNSSNQHQSASQTTSSPTSSAAGSGNNLDAPKSTSGAAPLVHGAVRFPAGSTAPPGSSYSTSGSTGSQSTSGPAASQHQQQQEVAPGQGERDVLKKAQLVCGRPQVGHHHQAGELSKKRVARIVGGNQSAFGQWPWMVSLRQWRKGAFLHKCGAALLNENWAITAAHCVENVKAPDLLLRLGEFDVSNQNEPYPYIERRVKSVMSHPLFDPKTFEYDLALIRFTEPILYERNILPVCVPQGNDSYVDRMATVIGWGRLFEDGPLPDVIQHVDVPIITNQECEKMYKNAGFVEEIPEMFICAGISKGGRDSCEGDSGGPLTMVDHDGRSYLVGIISWGIGCALPSQPGVYTRITAFSPWINQIISTLLWKPRDDVKEARFAQFPTVKPNASRIIITWPRDRPEQISSANNNTSTRIESVASPSSPPIEANVTSSMTTNLPEFTATLSDTNLVASNESAKAPTIATNATTITVSPEQTTSAVSFNSTDSLAAVALDSNKTTPATITLTQTTTVAPANQSDHSEQPAFQEESLKNATILASSAQEASGGDNSSSSAISTLITASLPTNSSSTTAMKSESSSSTIDVVVQSSPPTKAPPLLRRTSSTSTTKRWAEFKTSSRRPTTLASAGGSGPKWASSTRPSRPVQQQSVSGSGGASGPSTKSPSELEEVVQDWMNNYVHTTRRPYDSKRDCGLRPMQREGRVVGGRDSHLGEFPWSVLIRETTMLGFFIKTKCGGVLIDLKWVLTAAHCQPSMFGSLLVVVGEYDLSNAGKPSPDRASNKPIVRRVKRMIIHRDYNPSNFDNDIALLELESPYQVQPHVVPICLPDKDEDFIGQQALVAGWGKLSFGGPVPKVLQVAKLPVIGNKHCQEMYHNSGHMKIISDSFLCAGYENGGQDSCEGDSGGPLQVQRNDSRWVLAGTVSHGIKCAEPNLPGIYIRTAAYLPWIKAVTYHQDQNKRYGPALVS